MTESPSPEPPSSPEAARAAFTNFLRQYLAEHPGIDDDYVKNLVKSGAAPSYGGLDRIYRALGISYTSRDDDAIRGQFESLAREARKKPRGRSRGDEPTS